MYVDDIVFDCEQKGLKIGDVYLFSDSFQALKHYDRSKTNLENNTVNKKYGYVYKGYLKCISKRSTTPFTFSSINDGVLDRCTFLCRL